MWESGVSLCSACLFFIALLFLFRLSSSRHHRIMGLTTLRGRSLGRIIGLVGAVGFVLQGYDQAVANGLLTLGSFISVFPEIDTVNTHGSQKSHNSTIQGMLTAKKK